MNRSDCHAPEDVLPACQLTLKNLQLDYLDLYLVREQLTVNLYKDHLFSTSPYAYHRKPALILCL